MLTRHVKLYLIRHADAVREELVGSDPERWLSLRGREEARGLARLLREQGVSLDAIVTSPLVRAVQTAELLAGGLDFLGVVAVLPALAPGAHPRRAAEALPAFGSSVAIVGHAPGISALTALLLGIPGFPSFHTAQCAAIENGKPTFTSRADTMQTQTLFVE